MAEPLRPALQFWTETLGLAYRATFSDYAQLLQEALDPTSESARNEAGGMNVFLLRPGDVIAYTDELAEALRVLISRSTAAHLAILCPDATDSDDAKRIFTALEGISNLELITAEEVEALYPVENPFDSVSDTAAHVPYTEVFFTALATLIARRLAVRLRPPTKVLALDADHTLWRGVCGEDAPAALDLGGPWRSLREFALAKRRSGMLLALVSKNREEDVAAVFSERAGELGLSREDFSGWKANWNAKSQSLHELAEELNLGLDSFVFIDDNPVETAEVAANCPSVLALTLPEDPEKTPGFLAHLWALDTLPTTAADALRTEFYRHEAERQNLRKTALSFPEFLRSLELQITIREVDEADVPRIAQLTKRTNQFNANPLRLSESEVSQRINDGSTCLSVHVSDRFGDYGLVGAILTKPVLNGAMIVDLFLLSCRAMGKGVERVMVKELGRRALSARATSLSFAHTKTDRNEPCLRFFDQLGGFSLNAQEMANLSAIPPEVEADTIYATANEKKSTPASLHRPDGDLARRIATELHSPEAILALLKRRKRRRPDLASSMVTPGTQTQMRLVALWSEILGVEGIGIEDSFSALGGSSLQLVQLHAALRRDFGSQLELVDLFELPTISMLADRLDQGCGTSAHNFVQITDSAEGQATQSESNDDEDAVAVIGMALRVPGADDPEHFWKNLREGVESISQFRKEEIAYPEEFGQPGFIAAKGVIENVDLFDAAFFGVLPNEAKIMDPQQRIFLELAWEAMERGGYGAGTPNHRVGVWAGAYFDTYLLANLCTDSEFLSQLIPQIQVGTLQAELGNDKDYLATRVAFKLNLRGPAINLQSACSTSLVAVAEACRAIRDGLCDMALAGGVTVTLPLKRGYFYTEQGMLSGDGHCRAFDKDASGTVFGNGAGVVLLKRYRDAIRDRDHIYSVIRGIGLNNDGGVKHSYTAPSVEGQADVIRMAHRDAGIAADSIGYIEAHGTATPLGDPIEIAALTKAFRSSGASANQYCAIGSLKTNIGHLDVASGVCGLIKTSLSLKNAMLPPILHYREPNPKIDFANSPFYVNASLSPWEQGVNGQPRRAGVSSFGVGGTNAHIVLEEAPKIPSKPSHRKQQIFLLSARSENALNAAVARLAQYAEERVGKADEKSEDLADVAWTLAVGRKLFRYRRAIVAGDSRALASALDQKSTSAPSVVRNNPPVNFLFPGQGAQHLEMGRAFYESEPRFRETLDRCSAILQPLMGVNLIDALFPPEGADRDAATHLLTRTLLAQPAIFSIEYALADLWLHWGITPHVMLGHSVGEFVAACHAGVFSLEDGLRLLAARGRIMDEMPGGGMLSVRLSETDLLARMPASLDLAASNGPQLCVVAGPHEDLNAFRSALEADGIVSQELHTSHAFHSRMMDKAVERFTEELANIRLHAPQLPILSTITGEMLTEAETTDPRYWGQHMRETVRFHRSVVLLGAKEEGQIFLEVGPGNTLASLARQALGRSSGHAIFSTSLHVKEKGDDYAHALESLGALWSTGVEVDWQSFYSRETRNRIPLPTYPFERKRFWIESKAMRETITSPLTTSDEADSTAELSFSLPPMSTTEPIHRRPAIIDAIRTLLSDLSGLPAEELAEDVSYLELGFDSLLLTQVSKSLSNEFGIPLTLRDLIGDLVNIGLLADRLDATLSPELYRPVMTLPGTVENAPALASATGEDSSLAPASSVSASVSSPASIPMMPAVSIPTLSVPENASLMERLFSQQFDLMRQQMSLLQGVTPANAISPAVVPPPAVSSPPKAMATAPVTALSQPSSPSAHDSSAPTTSIHREIASDLTPQQRHHLDALIASYTTKTRRSKELTAEYRQWHADPRTVSGFHREWKEMIYQIAVRKSKGSRLLDVDGNEYIDLLNGFGPNFLGHSPDFITQALKQQLDQGIEVGPQCQNAMEAARLFCEVTGNERASFVNTGSEAVQAAIRLARTVTGRDKIVMFSKDYHGNFDEVLVRSVGSGENLRSLPIAPGIPRRAVEDVIMLPYGTDESLEIIRSHAHELAAVIVEPIQSRRPEFQPREFIHELRRITHESGSVFVFDEVITGFRTGPHGAQGYYGVEADIATYGKVVAGGMPIGVVAGKAAYMDTFDGGMWQYGDDSFPGKDVTFFAGTFVRHPLAMAAVKQVLLFLRAQGPEYWQNIKAKADRLATTVDQMFVENGAPIRMPNFGSQMFLRVDPEHKYANLFFFHLRQKGIFLLEGFPCYMTAAHTDEDIDYCIRAFRESIAEMQEGGFFEIPASGGFRMDAERLHGPDPILSISSAENPESTVTASPASVAQDLLPLHPLSDSQAEVWLASQVSKAASLAFNEINLLELSGPLDLEALRRALQTLLDRHEALRAVYLPDGTGYRIQPSSVFDLTLLNEGTEQEILAHEQNTPFDLEHGPLIRASLLRRGQDDHYLILNAHHLACDGWSYNVILQELGALYEAEVTGQSANLSPAPSFVASTQSLPDSMEESEAWWQSQFATPVSPLDLPSDFPTPAETDFHCDSIAFEIDADTARALKRVAGKSGTTLFGLLFGAYQLLLHRLCSQSRFVIAFPSASQNATGQTGLVGHFVKFLPFTVDIDPSEQLSTFLKATQSHVLDALDHSACTFGRIIKNMSVDQRPRIDAVFNFERMTEVQNFGPVRAKISEAKRCFTTNPLFLKTYELDQGLEIRLDYHSSRFSPDTIGEWLETYRAILDAIAVQSEADLETIAAAMSVSQSQRLTRWNETTVPYPNEATIPQLFAEMAVENPDAIAIRHSQGEIRYAEFATMISRYAQAFAEAGAAPGTKVAILLDRSPEQIAALYAVMQCGAAYVPLDPEYPSDRLSYILNDSKATFVVTSESETRRIPREIPILNIAHIKKHVKQSTITNSGTKAGDAAFILYTSGSTGKPKGVEGTHRSAVRLVRNSDFMEFGSGETILHASSVCFDASLLEVHGPLLNGGTIAIPPAGKLSLETLSDTITRHSVTRIWLTAGLFQVMVDECLEAFSGLRQVISGGDVMSPKHAQALLSAYPQIRLTNGYGPTENTTFTTCHEVRESDLLRRSIPIGKPIANTTVYILDEALRPLPPGIPGELWTGGDGLALGYLGNPELTAQKFIRDPFNSDPSARIYRTGDRCRFLSDGSIEFLGRIDMQVKIRGFRVEPGEIEAVLSQHPHVGQCRVVSVGEGAAEKSLAAFASPRNGVRPTSEELIGYLRSKLPDYLVPSSLVVLDHLPLNPNGKIDQHKLPRETGVVLERDETPSPTEEELRTLWIELLKTPEVSLDDDFFTLGGHSLLGMKLFSRVQRAFGVSLPLAALFRAPTIRQLARLIDERLQHQDEKEEEHDEIPSRHLRGIYLLASSLDPVSRPTESLNETTVAIQAEGVLPPLFAVHGGDGGILFYGNLATRLDKNRPFYAFEAPALTATSPIPNEPIEETAAHYLRDMRKVQPHGPYHIIGYSFGGLVAYEMACQLEAVGEEVKFLGLIDTENPLASVRKLSIGERVAVNWRKKHLAKKNVFQKVGHIGMRFGSGLAYRLFFEAEDTIARTLPEAKGAGWLRQVQLRKAHERAMSTYMPSPYPGKLTLLRAMIGGDKFEIGEDYGWRELAGELQIIDVPGNHINLFNKENIEAIATAIRQELNPGKALALVKA